MADQNENTHTTCEELIQTNKSVPRSAQEVADAKKDFTNGYSVVNPNLKVEPVTIHLNDILRFLTNYPHDLCRGLVFHYGYNPTSHELEYIMSWGELKVNDKGELEIWPLPFKRDDHSEYYLLLAGKLLPPREVTAGDLETSSDLYFANLKMKTPTGAHDIDQIADHPRMIYHQGSELNKFYVHNQGKTPTILYIYPGQSATLGQNDPYHVPLFCWGNAAGPFPLDPHSSQHDYKERALDLGHLCPPYCKD